MSNTDVEALKELYAKMGGDDDVAAINTSSEMIRKLGDAVESGGGSGGNTQGPYRVVVRYIYPHGDVLDEGWTYDRIASLIEQGIENIYLVYYATTGSTAFGEIYTLSTYNTQTGSVSFTRIEAGDTAGNSITLYGKRIDSTNHIEPIYVNIAKNQI